MAIPPYATEPGFGEGPGQFRSTHWSVVLAAADSQSPQTAEALEKLCHACWYPLYAHVRRQGFDAHEAQDLTQAFFAYLLEKKGLGRVDPVKGKFRSFLLASLNNFLNNERDKAQRIKRGGGAQFIYLDAGPAEERYLAEPAHDESPERIFERSWANAVVEQVARKLTLGIQNQAWPTITGDGFNVFACVTRHWFCVWTPRLPGPGSRFYSPRCITSQALPPQLSHARAHLFNWPAEWLKIHG